jgi:hypothetical protein
MRGGRVQSSAGSGAQKKVVRMVTEGSVLSLKAEPVGTAIDVAPEGFAHPVYRSGFALSFKLPSVDGTADGTASLESEPAEKSPDLEELAETAALVVRPWTRSRRQRFRILPKQNPRSWSPRTPNTSNQIKPGQIKSNQMERSPKESRCRQHTRNPNRRKPGPKLKWEPGMVDPNAGRKHPRKFPLAPKNSHLPQKKRKAQAMKYKVTALTPLLVGDGRALSPIDYMVWKDQVNVLDQNRIFKLLARGPRLEGYLSQLRKATKLDFASWGGFAQNFSQRRIAFEHPDSTAIWNAAPSESLFIPTFTANYRGAYLPASALKGALRTGLVFSRWSPATVDRLAASLEHDRLPRRVSEATENNSGASQVRVLSVADSEPLPPSAFKVFLTRTASVNPAGEGRQQLSWKVAGRGSVPSGPAR